MVGQPNREEMLSQGDPPTGIPRDEGEDDLTRLFASGQPPVAPSSEFKERLFRQLAASLQEPVGQVQYVKYPEGKQVPSAPARVADRLPAFLRGIATAGQTPTRRLVLAAAAVLIVVMGVRLVRQATVPALVTLAMEQGTSEVVRSGFLGLGAPQALTVDRGSELPLAAGDEIMTGSDSKALLRLYEGSTIELAPGTQLSIADLQATSADRALRLTLELRAGEAVNRIARQSLASQGRFVIRTPSATIAALGALFRLQVVSASHTFLSVDEGVVRIAMADDSTNLYAGEEIDARVGQSLVVRAQGPEREIAEGEFLDLLCARRLLLPGLASGGDSVDIFLNGVWTDTLSADAEGKFTYAVDTAEEGSYEVVARATNRRGHTSQEVMLARFAIDCSPPPLVITEPWDPKVASSQVVLTGRTEPGTEVKIGEEQVTVDSEGVFSAILELVPGGNPLTITATDKAGNTLTIYPVLVL